MLLATACLDPLAKRRGALVAEELAVDLQQVGPFVGPVLDEIRAADQLVDQLVAFDLAGPGVLQELADRFRFGRQAGQVEIDPANEFAVAAQVARQDLDLLELVVHQVVDPVELGRFLPGKPAAVAHDDERGGGVVALVAGQDGGLAAAHGRDDALLSVHGGHFGVAAFEIRLGGDVAPGRRRRKRPMTVICCLMPASGQHGRLRIDFDAGHARACSGRA